MFAEQIDAEFFACLSEPKLSVQCQDIGEDASAMPILNKLQELLSQLSTWMSADPMQSAAIEVVDALVLMMKRFMQDAASETLRLKHAGHEWLEFDIAMVQLTRDRASQLDLNSLEADITPSA